MTLYIFQRGIIKGMVTAGKILIWLADSVVCMRSDVSVVANGCSVCEKRLCNEVITSPSPYCYCNNRICVDTAEILV